MRSFVYSSSTKVVTVNVYRIVRNRPVHIGKLSDDYTTPFQLAMAVLALYKQLPPRAFQRYPNGCTMYTNAAQLQADGLAYVEHI